MKTVFVCVTIVLLAVMGLDFAADVLGDRLTDPMHKSWDSTATVLFFIWCGVGVSALIFAWGDD